MLEMMSEIITEWRGSKWLSMQTTNPIDSPCLEWWGEKGAWSALWEGFGG